MKKIIVIWAALVLLSSCGTDVENSNIDTVNNSNAIVEETIDRNTEVISWQPEYKAELYGKVKSI